ncbi:MAG TPA: hypothetical protein P5250_01045, partial [Bacteroidales bacterium]|nr:hypothetical protein [Bacteroidales bacterium]
MQIKLKHNIALIVIILFLTIINNIASAQTRISSPYSRYKLGTSQKNLFAQNLGLGLTSGIRNEATVNFGNPASYTSFDTTSFVFDVGLNNYFNILQNSVTKQKYNYTSLGYLLFGFPVTKWWGSSFGLTPFSKTGYKMSFSQYIDSLGNVNYIYEGNGGINRFYWGNGFKIIKNISVGVNASFLFGSLDKIRSIIFIDSTKIYNVRIKNSTIISDIVFNWGIQYYTFIKPDLKLTLGSSFNTNSNLNAKQNIIVQRFLSNNTGYEIIKDTVANNTKQKG